MTARQLYFWCKKEFAKEDIEEFDALSLALHVFGMSRTELLLTTEAVAPAQESWFRHLAAERLSRRPLQYLLGQWEFMGLTLRVGEGVLIPREDTVCAVQALASLLEKVSSPCGLDLCAGSGAMALGLCTLLPGVQAVCLEASPTAYAYLEQNLAAHPEFALSARLRDILLPETAAEFTGGELDFLLSNPPYISRQELPSLQEEVLHEPVMALDGGEDGLVFYRGLAKLWFPLLKSDGAVSVEIGETQAEAVVSLFAAHGISGLAVHKDLAGLDRCVTGIKKN